MKQAEVRKLVAQTLKAVVEEINQEGESTYPSSDEEDRIKADAINGALDRVSRAIVRAADNMLKEEPATGHFYELQASDIGQSVLKLFGRTWRAADFIGRVLPGDVGRRVYHVDGVLQVENNEQRKARLAKVGGSR